MIPIAAREDVARKLRAWADGALDAAALKSWVESVRTDEPGPREALAEMDLLEVHLLTPDDAAALLALVESDDPAAAAAWARHRASIDLDSRSRALRKNPLYRPFCR